MSERDVTPPKGRFQLKPRILLIVIIIIIILGSVLSAFFVVDQTEQAVVLRFGHFNRTMGAGLQFKLPFGIEKNYNVPTQIIQNMQFGFRTEQPGIDTIISSKDFPEESIMLTGDLNIVDVEWIIQYRISDPYKWLFQVEMQDKTIRDISQSVINQLVGDRTIFDVIGAERSNVEVQAMEKMNNYFDLYNLGATVTTVKLQNIVPPAGEVQDAFEDVNKAIQDMERLINEGKEAYNRQIPKAQGDADKMVQIAQGYAAERVNEARGNVARFQAVLDEYSTSQDVTRARLYIEMIEDVFGQKDGTDLIDRNLDNFIPLKTLQQQAQELQGGTQ